MSHGGPLTLAQKRMMAMRSENAANAPTTDPQPMPLLPAVYDQSSSASTSPRNTDNRPSLTFEDIEMQDISAPATPNYSHSRPPPSFSAAARPFVPPGVTNHTTETMSSASATPMKRLPPHRAMQTQTPKNSAAIPIVMPEPPSAPALMEQSALEPPVRRAGPHAKLGPHARKVDTPIQADAPSTGPVQSGAPSNVSDNKIDVQQSNSDTNTWAGVQESQVETQVAQSESSTVQETQVKAGAPALDVEESLNQDNRVTRHIGPNKWLAILDDLKDPEKGCEIILALADHLRASIESRELNSPREIVVLMESASGQRMPAKVDSDMTVSDMIKQCASYVSVNESDIQIVLKINQSEEL